MLVILDEAAERLAPVLKELDSRGIAYSVVNSGQKPMWCALDKEQDTASTLYLNRVSPSAFLRGNDAARDYVRVLLEKLAFQQARVVNGGTFQVEMSKVSQWHLLRRAGISTPPTTVCVGDTAALVSALGSHATVHRRAMFIKPDRGGSGMGVERFDDAKTAITYLRAQPADMLRTRFQQTTWIIQSEVCPADAQYVYRLEFVDREVLYLVRLDRSKGYRLCPSCPLVRARQMEKEARFQVQVRAEARPPPPTSRQWPPPPPPSRAATLRAKINSATTASSASSSSSATPPTHMFEIIEPASIGLPDDFIDKCKACMRLCDASVAAFEFSMSAGPLPAPFVHDLNFNTNYNTDAEERAGLGAGYGVRRLVDMLVRMQSAPPTLSEGEN